MLHFQTPGELGTTLTFIVGPTRLATFGISCSQYTITHMIEAHLDLRHWKDSGHWTGLGQWTDLGQWTHQRQWTDSGHWMGLHGSVDGPGSVDASGSTAQHHM